MRVSPLILALFPLAANAQSFLVFGTDALPECARSCSTIADANAACSGSSNSDQTAFTNCICANPNLSVLQNSPTVCNTVCTAAADLAQIQAYYKSTCSSASTAASTTLKTTTTKGKTTAKATATATAAAASATANSSAGIAADSSNPSWWSQHSRWIAMVIVLIIGFAIIIAVGIWLKKRHRRKAQQAANLAPPVVWGPHQNQHHTGEIQYMGSGVNTADKGKARVTQEMGEASNSGGRKKLGRR